MSNQYAPVPAQQRRKLRRVASDALLLPVNLRPIVIFIGQIFEWLGSLDSIGPLWSELFEEGCKWLLENTVGREREVEAARRALYRARDSTVGPKSADACLQAADRLLEALNTDFNDFIAFVTKQHQEKMQSAQANHLTWILQHRKLVGAIQAIVDKYGSRVRIVTTSYDTFIEDMTHWDTAVLCETDIKRFLDPHPSYGRCSVLHLNGVFKQPSSLIFGSRSYHDILNPKQSSERSLRTLVKALVCNHNVIFIGCSSLDQNPLLTTFFELWQDLITVDVAERHFLLCPDEQWLQNMDSPQAHLSLIGILPVGQTASELAEYLGVMFRLGPSVLTRLQSSISPIPSGKPAIWSNVSVTSLEVSDHSDF